MPWRNANALSKPRWLLLSAIVFGSCIPCVMPTVAYAVDSEVQVKVCGADNPGAELKITQPKNDSVVDQSVTTFRGTVKSTSQIVVTIDEQYSQTVAIGNNQVAFAIDVTLEKGTHTVSMTASEICGGADGEDTVVVTYEPKSKPSNGGVTPTAVGPQPTAPAVTTNAINSNELSDLILTIPGVGMAVNTVSDLATSTGLASTLNNGNNAVVGVARVILTVLALASIVMAGTFAPMMATSVPGLSEVFSVNSHRSMLYLGWIIRGVGVLAMAMAYFL